MKDGQPEPAVGVKQHTILITVEGGVIQDIQGIPAEVRILVRDYDVDGTKEDLGHDDNGDHFVESVWE